MEDITISLECPSTEILGVLGKEIHLLTHGFKDDGNSDFDCVLVVPIKTYLQEWKNWIDGKREYCERYKHYCGVMGTVSAKDPVETGTQTIFKWNEKTEDMEEIEVPLYTAIEFEGPPDFEHG